MNITLATAFYNLTKDKKSSRKTALYLQPLQQRKVTHTPTVTNIPDAAPIHGTKLVQLLSYAFSEFRFEAELILFKTSRNKRASKLAVCSEIPVERLTAFSGRLMVPSRKGLVTVELCNESRKEGSTVSFLSWREINAAAAAAAPDPAELAATRVPIFRRNAGCLKSEMMRFPPIPTSNIGPAAAADSGGAAGAAKPGTRTGPFALLAATGR